LALRSNTIGSDDTASGADALIFNTEGYQNTATGSLALAINAEGYQNTATGASALSQNTSGVQNTAYVVRRSFSTNAAPSICWIRPVRIDSTGLLSIYERL